MSDQIGTIQPLSADVDTTLPSDLKPVKTERMEPDIQQSLIDTNSINAVCGEIDKQINSFEREVLKCEQHMSSGALGHRHSVDLHSWMEKWGERLNVADDVSPTLVFFARCALGYLCNGAISEKELRLAVIDSCKRSDVRVNNRGGLSGSQVDLSIICGVLQTLGVLEEEKKSKTTRKTIPSASCNSLNEIVSEPALGGDMAAQESGSASDIVNAGWVGVGPTVAVAGCELHQKLTIKTEWMDTTYAMDPTTPTTTELRKGFNDAHDITGQKNPAYYEHSCGVDRYVLDRFVSRLTAFIEQLESKQRLAVETAALQAEKEREKEKMREQLSLDSAHMALHDDMHDIGLGLDIGIGLDLGPDAGVDEHGQNHAVAFGYEDDGLLFDTSEPLDALTSGELDMLELGDMSNPGNDEALEALDELEVADGTALSVLAGLVGQRSSDGNTDELVGSSIGVDGPVERTSHYQSVDVSSNAKRKLDMPSEAMLTHQSPRSSSMVSPLPRTAPNTATENAVMEVVAELAQFASGREQTSAETAHVGTGTRGCLYPLGQAGTAASSAFPSHLNAPMLSASTGSGYRPVGEIKGGYAANTNTEDAQSPAPEMVIRLPSYSEASLIARGYRQRKVEAMCVSLKHVYNNGLFFKKDKLITPLVASSIYGYNSWDNMSVATADGGLKSPCWAEGASSETTETAAPVKPKRGRRPKIRLPAEAAYATLLDVDDAEATPKAVTPSSSRQTSLPEGEKKRSGPKNFNSNFGSRVWKMNHELDDLFSNPPEVFSNWAEACYLNAKADELEEAALRQLGGMCGVAFPVKETIMLGTGYLEELPELELVKIVESEYQPDSELVEEEPDADAVTADEAEVTPVRDNPAPAQPSGGRRRSGSTAPAFLTADLLLHRFKRRGNPNNSIPVLSLRENKTVQFKSPEKKAGVGGEQPIFLSTEDVMIDGEVSAFPPAALPSVHHRKRAKSVSVSSGPSAVDIIARHHPAPMPLFVSKMDEPTEEDYALWEAVLGLGNEETGNMEGEELGPLEVGIKRKRQRGEPRIYLPMLPPDSHCVPPPQLNSSVYRGRYMVIPDLALHSEPMHWESMAGEFGLLSDIIAGEQALLLYSSGGEATPGSKGAITPNSGNRKGGEDMECDEEDDDDITSEAEDEVLPMDIDEDFGGADAELPSPSRRSSRMMKKSSSDLSLASANSSNSVVSGIANISDFSKTGGIAGGVLKNKSSEKRRKRNTLTINVPLSNRHKMDGPESGRYSAKKFAAVQSPSFRLLEAMHFPTGVSASLGKAACSEVEKEANSSGEDSDAGSEDTSDEVYTRRHEFVLEQMREKFKAIQELKKERKEQKKKEKSGRFASGAHNIAVHNAKRQVDRSASFGSEGDFLEPNRKKKIGGNVTQSLHSAQELVVSSPRKRVPVNREIESYVPPTRPPTRTYQSHSRVALDTDGNPIVRKRGRPQKVVFPSPPP